MLKNLCSGQHVWISWAVCLIVATITAEFARQSSEIQKKYDSYVDVILEFVSLPSP